MNISVYIIKRNYKQNLVPDDTTDKYGYLSTIIKGNK